MERPRGLIPARLQSPDAENRTSGGVGALAGATSRQGDPICQIEGALSRYSLKGNGGSFCLGEKVR